MKTVKPLWVYVVQAAIRPAMKCAIAALLLWSLWLASGFVTTNPAQRAALAMVFAIATTGVYLLLTQLFSIYQDLYRGILQKAQQKRQADLRRKEDQR